MSRLWDTSEFWARSGVDELLEDHPGLEPRDLVARLARGKLLDADSSYTETLLRELRKRAEARVRFWPDHDASADMHRELQAASASGDVDERAPLGSPANPFWWQRL